MRQGSGTARTRHRRSPARSADGLASSRLSTSVVYQIKLAQLRAYDAFYHRFAGSGFTPLLFAIHALIVANPGVRPRAIARHLGLASSECSAAIDQLVMMGLAMRLSAVGAPCALGPTMRGREEFDNMWREHCIMDAEYVQSLTEDERELFLRMIRTIAA